MELSSLLKIVPLTINCDTLLITTSSVFEVKHVNSDDVEELKRIVEECKDRYRIVVLSEDYLSGREIVKKIEDSRSKD